MNKLSKPDNEKDMNLLPEEQKTMYEKLKAKENVETYNLRAELKAMTKERSTLMSNIESIHNRIKNWEGSVDGFAGQTEEMRKSIAKLEKETDSLKKDIWQCEERLKNQSRDMKDDSKKCDGLHRELREIDQKIRDAKLDRHQEDNEKDSKNILDNMKRLYPGVKGRIVDLVTPKNAK